MLHSLLAPPGFGDILWMLGYLLSHPHMFIGSTTVMTTGLVVGTGALAVTAAFARGTLSPRAAWSDRVLDWIAPKLALVLAYFGVGSMVLATEILIRFHHVFPDGTEMQFRSGLGHLAVALFGIALLRSRLRRRSARTWVEAHFWALTYLTAQVMVLTPPWFNFQFQGELVLGVARGVLAAALAANLVLWRRWA